MSRNLLSIEASFLNLSEVKQALNLQAINRLKASESNAQKQKFSKSIELSKLVKQAFEWFQSEEGKAKMREEGIEWNAEQFGLKVFGWQKSFFYKILKVGKLPSETIEKFNEKCDELEQQDEQPIRSIETLLKFAKQVEDGAEGSGTNEESEEGAEVETRAQTIFTMTLKHPEKNVAIRIDDAGQVKTNNTIEEIETAIVFLRSCYMNIQQG